MSKITVRLAATAPAAQVVGLHAAYGDALREDAVVLTLRMGEHDYVVLAPREGHLLPLVGSGDEVGPGDALFALHIDSAQTAQAEVEEAKLRLPVGPYRPANSVGPAAGAENRPKPRVASRRRASRAASTPDDLRQRVGRQEEGQNVAAQPFQRRRPGRSGRLALPLLALPVAALAGVALFDGWDLLPFGPVRLEGPPPSVRVQVPPAQPGALLPSAVSGVRGGIGAGPPDALLTAPLRPTELGLPSKLSGRTAAAPTRPSGQIQLPAIPRPSSAGAAALPTGPVEKPPRVSRRSPAVQTPISPPDRRAANVKTVAIMPQPPRPPDLSGPPVERGLGTLPTGSIVPQRTAASAIRQPVQLVAEVPLIPQRPVQPRASPMVARGEAPRPGAFDIAALGRAPTVLARSQHPQPSLPGSDSPRRPLSALPRDPEPPTTERSSDVLSAEVPSLEAPSTEGGSTSERSPREASEQRTAGVVPGSAATSKTPALAMEKPAGLVKQPDTSAGVTATGAILDQAASDESSPSPVEKKPGDATPSGDLAPEAEIALASQPLAHSAMSTAVAPFTSCGPLAFAGPDPLPPGAPIHASGPVASPDDSEAIRWALSGLGGRRRIALDLTVTSDTVCRIERILPPPNARGLDFRFGYGRKRGTPAKAAYVAGENPVVDVVIDGSLADRFLYVFYIDAHTGRVIHLLPYEERPENRVRDAGVEGRDGYRVRILHPADDVGPGRRGFLVGPPFGTNVLLAVASSQPLREAIQPNEDSAEPLVRQVAEALRRSEPSGYAISRRFFTTRPE